MLLWFSKQKSSSISIWAQFHQYFTHSSFLLQILKAEKDTDDLTAFFELLGSTHVKAGRRHIDEIDP